MNRLRDKTIEYLELKLEGFKKDRKLFTCPECKQVLANFIPHSPIKAVHCHGCSKHLGDIFDIVKIVEPDKIDYTPDELIYYLKELLEVDLITKKDILSALDFFSNNKFDLTPIARDQKIPIEKEWTTKTHTNRNEWEEWIFSNGNNVGVKTGKCSNITVVDIDTKTIPPVIEEWYKKNKTLSQTTEKGYHFFFQYDPELPTTRIEDLKIDILNDGKQCVIFPSVVDKKKRDIFFNDIAPMPVEIKLFLREHITLPNLKSFSEKLKEDIKAENFSDLDFKDIEEGNRNNALIKLGGILRKELSLEQTSFVLDIVNKRFCTSPIPVKEFSAMIGSLDRYVVFDEQELAGKILAYLRLVEEASSTDIRETLGERTTEGKQRIEKALAFLVKEHYIIKKRRYYSILKRLEWKDTFMGESTILPYKIPYFYDFANFRNSDMILIGAGTKVGKTHIGMNIVKSFVDQGVKPYYVNLEAGNRFSIIANHLGLKEGDFWYSTHFSPDQIELEKNAVTIIDWLLPQDYANTDKLFQHFAQQLVKQGGMLIVFMQLRNDGKFFAENMVSFFPSFVSRYFYTKNDQGVEDPSQGYFQVDYIREPKSRIKKGQIPCKYLWEERKLVRLDEIKTDDDNESPIQIGGLN